MQQVLGNDLKNCDYRSLCVPDKLGFGQFLEAKPAGTAKKDWVRISVNHHHHDIVLCKKNVLAMIVLANHAKLLFLLHGLFPS